MTVNIMALSENSLDAIRSIKMAPSITTLSITTLSLMILSIYGLIVTRSIKHPAS